MADSEIPDRVTLKFDLPIEHGGKTYEEMTLRRPTYGELLEAKKRADDGDLFLTARLSGIPAAALVKADADVMLEAADVLQRFLERRQLKTGET